MDWKSSIIFLYFFFGSWCEVYAFRIRTLRSSPTTLHSKFAMSLTHDIISSLQPQLSNIQHSVEPVASWIQHTASGIADAATTSSPPPTCPGFGQPGWAPFCFLNGNPVFKAFDVFQAFVQNSVISLHDLLAVSYFIKIFDFALIYFYAGGRHRVLRS